MPDNTDKPDYQGMRALMLTRVSTSEQEKMYGHTWQEMEIRKKLIQPLGLQLDEERHIIHDTYSGLEFRHREALTRILEMAERHEFDVLVMEVLDRGLGRKGIAREMFRMQLRELGVRVLTCDPDDHADDDSLIGEMIRLIKGYKAEEEIHDFVRRSRGGKRAKATGDTVRGIPPKIVGNGVALFGYKFTYDQSGKRAGLAINYEIIHTEPNGTEWSEYKVVLFIFDEAEKGTPVRQIAILLNAKGIPSPALLRGIKTKTHQRGESTIWQPAVVSRMLRQTAYKGESVYFRTKAVKLPGRKWQKRVATDPSEQIIVPVPAIIEPERFDALQEYLGLNQKIASRNNKHAYDTLLIGGFAKCAQCGGTMTVNRRVNRYKNRKGADADAIRYVCTRSQSQLQKCNGSTSIDARLLDEAAWEYAISIIRNPSVVDQRIQELKASDSSAKQRERARANLALIRKKQAKHRQNLNDLMQEEKVDKGTRAYLLGQLEILGKQEQDAQRELDDEQALQEKYRKLQARLTSFHRCCTEWRENLDNPQFKVSYNFQREVFKFFGISITVYKSDMLPRYKLESRPPTIVSLLSSTA